MLSAGHDRCPGAREGKVSGDLRKGVSRRSAVSQEAAAAPCYQTSLAEAHHERDASTQLYPDVFDNIL